MANQPKVRFQDLKPGTQTRKLNWYQKHEGLNPRQVKDRYNRGTLGPQTGARGKTHTPEHPDRLTDEPKYDKYRENRRRAVEYIFAFKKAKWDTRPFWNEGRARKNITVDPETGKKRGIRDIRIIEKMARQAVADPTMDYWAIVALDDDYETAFYYH